MTALEQVQQLLTTHVQRWQTPEENRADAHLAPENLSAAVKTLDAAGWGYLAAITGLDPGLETSTLEVLYHFCSGSNVLTLRVCVPREQPTVPSICDRLPYANVFERELGEMFGINIDGTPDASRLFLPDDWTEGVYPLRKDAELD